MSVRWTPNGALDITTDPCDLPVQVEGKVEVSGAMTRCTNLNLDEMGKAKTRYGSAKLNASPVSSTPILGLAIQSGARYSFGNTDIFLDEVSLGATVTAAKWSSVLNRPFNVDADSLFCCNGTDRKRIEGSNIYEWGIEAPASAPVIVAGALTGLTGDYNAKYSYCRKVSGVVVCESSQSPAASAAVALSNDSLSITWAASSDSQVTHVRVYRTIADGTDYYLEQDIAIGTTTLDSNKADSALGAEGYTNHTRPPLGSVVLGPMANGYLFMLFGQYLYYSLQNQPEYWPEEYYLEVSQVEYPLVAGGLLDGQLFVASKAEIYMIQGTGPTSFYPLGMSAQTGTRNAQCFLPIMGYGILHLGYDGLYQYTGGKDHNITNGRFQKIFQGEDSGMIAALEQDRIDYCWMILFKGKVYFGYPGTGASYPDNVLVIDLKTERWLHYILPAEMVSVAVDNYNQRLVAIDSSGYPWQIEKTDATDDDGTAISWEIQTGEFNSLRKYFPRYARYDVTVGTGGSANGYLLMDGTSKQTHSLSGTRLTKKRLVDGCAGDRMALKISGSGDIIIYGAEIE